MYGEFDRRPLDNTNLMFVVGPVPPFPQEVNETVNRGIWNDELVSEKNPRCTTGFQQPVQSPNLIRVRSRCNKMAFLLLLTFVATTLLATPFIL